MKETNEEDKTRSYKLIQGYYKQQSRKRVRVWNSMLQGTYKRSSHGEIGTIKNK
jgi:hypothetical protein